MTDSANGADVGADDDMSWLKISYMVATLMVVEDARNCSF